MQKKTRKRLQFIINVGYVAVIAALVYLGYKYVLSWVLPFFLAFCIVSILNPIIRFVNSKLKINHKVASVAVMVLLYGLTGYLALTLIMQAFYVGRTIFTILPSYYDERVAPAITEVGRTLDRMIGNLSPQWADHLGGVQDGLLNAIQSMLVSISQSGMGLVTGFTGSIPSFLIAFVFTIMLSFFVGSHYSAVTAFMMAQLPERAKGLVRDLKTIINDIILRYLGAMVKLMLITFVELSIGLLVLRTRNALLIAAGIAIFDALPLFGTGAIVIPWALIEMLSGNLTYALGLVILYAIVTVVRNIIEPHIVGRKLGLNPIVSITSIYLGYKLMGVFGMIIMPIVFQIVLELNKRGMISIFKPVPERESDLEAERPEQPEPDENEK